MRKKGFTLIEMIVVLTIIVITALIAVPSLFNYLARAEQLTRTETAKLIYLTAQNQLTQIRALGNLKSAYGDEISGKYFEKDAAGDYTDDLIPGLTGTNNVYDILTDANYPAPDLENGEDDYIRYLSKPAGEDLDHPLTQLLMPGIHDSQILEGTILIEYNILTGKILSVFYTDDDSISEFVYSSDSSASDIMGPRAELYDDIALDRRQGYYGVDYTGEVAPDQTFQISINIYDGYDDGEDDTAILPGISKFNKNLTAVNDRNNGASLENVLYAEIFIEKAFLEKSPAPTFDISLSGFANLIADDIDLTTFAANETLEDALFAFDDGSRELILYRNDSLTGDPDFARFIWVLDYVGGDMSGENDERYKYSITNLADIDGNTIDFNGISEITATIIDSSNPAALPVQSNPKHPLFADESNLAVSANPQAYIATSRHLSNIRHIDDNENYTYSQIADIDFAHDNGFIEIAGDFANSATDDEWNLKMSPIPPLSGTYSALYTQSGTTSTGVRTIQNLFVFDVNFDTDPADYTEYPADVINRSVGLFETIETSGEISHLTFINPYIEVKNTPAYYPGPNPDDGKYAGVVTGFSNGTISHITIISDSDVAPVYDLDNNTNSDNDYTQIAGDYVGGVVGLVGDSIAENAINHILYLAVAPYEEVGSSSSNRVRYDYPIIGEYLSDTAAATSNATRAIDETSCYYLVGDAVRPTAITLTPQVGNTTAATSTTHLNANRITYGYGKAISTTDIYTDMQNIDSDFHKNFMVAADGTTRLYSFSTTVTDPADGTTTSSLRYPYPYYGNILPNNDAIDTGTITRDMNFAWPVATLEPFSAEYVYYEIYGNSLDFANPEIGIYQIDSSGNIVIDTLKDITGNTTYRILTDGYAIKVNRPYSMLNANDIQFTVNDVEIAASSIANWFFTYNQNYLYDEFIDRFKVDSSSEEIMSLLAINNSTFRGIVNNSTYNDTTDVIALQLNDKRADTDTYYINPLFAKAIYTEDATDAANMVYSVRSTKHLNNIGYYANSESVNSNFIQEADINLANFGDPVSRYPTSWSYSIVNPGLIYMNLKYNGNTYGSGAGLFDSGSVSAINYPFTGSYDGNGMTIRNLTKRANSTDVGLFNIIGETGEVYDLTIDNFDMTSTGLAVSGVVAADNRGTIRDVTVQNTDVLGTFSTYAQSGVTYYNRPTEVGGIVAYNSGTIEGAEVLNSTITRHEVTSVVQYGIRSHGVGGIAGSNSGVVTDSAVVNTTITAHDNFIGGIVGIMLDGGVVSDSMFVHDGEDAAGNPVTPISYDSTATLTSPNPRYTIGGIVGGIVFEETIATGNYVVDEGTISDTLFLAQAPTVASVADTIFPLVGALNGGFTLEDNIYLSGTLYSDDNINFVEYEYNTLAVNDAPSADELVGYSTDAINPTYLATYGDGRLDGWVIPASGYYMVPTSRINLVNVPYVQSRPKQIEGFVGTGVDSVTDGYTAEILFDGEYENFAASGSVIPVSISITNNRADFIASSFTDVDISFGDFASYIDIADFESSTAVITAYDNAGGAISSVNYTFDPATNTISIDTSSLSAVTVLSGEKISFGFDIPVKTEFTPSGFTTAIPTDYYIFRMGASLNFSDGATSLPLSLNSNNLHISPKTTITTTINGGLPIDNTGSTLSIPVATRIDSTNAVGYSKIGDVNIEHSGGFTIDKSSISIEVDGTAIASPTEDSDYTVVLNDNGTPETGDDTLNIVVLRVAPTSSVVISYNLSYTGIDGEFEISTEYTNYILKGGSPISEFILRSDDLIKIVTP